MTHPSTGGTLQGGVHHARSTKILLVPQTSRPRTLVRSRSQRSGHCTQAPGGSRISIGNHGTNGARARLAPALIVFLVSHNHLQRLPTAYELPDAPVVSRFPQPPATPPYSIRAPSCTKGYRATSQTLRAPTTSRQSSHLPKSWRKKLLQQNGLTHGLHM